MNDPIPLPVIDGTAFYGEPCKALIFDNSALEDWQTCKRLFQYKDLMQRQKASESAGRNFGSACHRAWEVRYKALGPARITPEVAAAMNDAMRAHFDANPQPLGDFRTLDHAQRYMAFYNTIYSQEPFEVVKTPQGSLFVEQGFALPMGEVSGYRLVYAGKVDLAIRNPDLWTLDHKTAFQFGNSFQREKEQDGGQLGYVWATGQALGVLPRGYIINACRVRKPSQRDSYSGEAPIDASDFQRLPYDVAPEQINDWQQDTWALVEEIIWCAQRGKMPRHRKACVGKYGVCDFYDVCSVMPAFRSQILESNLYQHNDWTPLRRPE